MGKQSNLRRPKMNKNIKIITWITAAVVSLSFAGNVQAQERSKRDRNKQEIVVVTPNQVAVNYDRRDRNARDYDRNDRRDRDYNRNDRRDRGYNRNDRRDRDYGRYDRRARNVIVVPPRGRYYAKNRHLSKKQLRKKIRKLRRIRRWNARYDNRPVFMVTPDRYRYQY